MVRVGKYLFYFLFFILSFVYFSPKLGAYYLVEKLLEEKHIIIDEERVYDNGFTLDLQNVNILFKSIDTFNSKNVNIGIFIFYNYVYIEGVKLTKIASTFIPLDIKSININYSIFSPWRLNASAEGDFGQADLEFDTIDKKIHLILKASPLMKKKYKSTLKNLKKLKDGTFVYDKNI